MKLARHGSFMDIEKNIIKRVTDRDDVKDGLVRGHRAISVMVARTAVIW
jgi:hypothetical protein